MPYIMEVASLGIVKAMEHDPAIAAAVNTLNGRQLHMR
jgi:hypothetical protein